MVHRQNGKAFQLGSHMGSVMGMASFNILICGLGDGIEISLTKFVDDTTVRGLQELW